VWLFDAEGGKHSKLDLCGRGQFTPFTGIGGEAWVMPRLWSARNWAVLCEPN
jgi:2,4-dichlorophenol 6-monooxygenase